VRTASEFHLDTLTLLFATACTAWMMAGAAFSLSRAPYSRRAYALEEWGSAMFVGGCAVMLLVLRGMVPFWLSFHLGNALVLLFPALCVRAFARLFERPVPVRGLLAGGALGLPGLVAVQPFGAPYRFAQAGMAAGLTVILLSMAALLVRHFAGRRAPLTWFTVTLLGALSTSFVARAARLLTASNSLSAHGAERFSVGTLLFSALFIIGGSVAFFAMVQERLRAESVERSRRDGLTGLLTRAAFFEGAEELARRRPPAHFAVLMVDIDHFKRINDTFGHQGGDMVLAFAARQISAAVRVTDPVGRYGGEEFCLLLPDCDEEAAGAVAERIVASVARQAVRLPKGRECRFTLSCGYAVREVDDGRALAEPLQQIIARADAALYRAKHEGRNRAVAAGPVSVVPDEPQGCAAPVLAPA
jgi:diguanylate cyclase (GGDEF)-like protein